MFLGKPFQDTKFLISWISLLRLLLQQIILSLTTKEDIHVFHFHIVYSINILINAYIKKTQVTNNKKLDRLFKKKKKQEEDGLKENPNNVIWNLTSGILSKKYAKYFAVALTME